MYWGGVFGSFFVQWKDSESAGLQGDIIIQKLQFVKHIGQKYFPNLDFPNMATKHLQKV